MIVSTLRWLLGLCLGLAISLSLASAVGEDPWHVLGVIWASGTGSLPDLSQSLFYSTSFMFTGLSVAVALRAGLFNIGAEGQLLMGSLGSTVLILWIGPWLFAENSGVLGFLMAFLLSFLFGAGWGLIPGLIKARFGSHEVVTTMMMNFIAAALTSYLVTTHFQNPDGQNPETPPVGDMFLMTSPWAPLNQSLLVAVALCGFVWWFFQKTIWGHAWRVHGHNPTAAQFNGIDRQKVIIGAMALAGGVSGLVALNEIFGSLGKLRLGFSADYGFVGIAVALLARNHPLAVIPSAILFGILQKGATDLSLETDHINRDFSKIIQAIIVLSVLITTSDRITRWWPEKLKTKLGATSRWM